MTVRVSVHQETENGESCYTVTLPDEAYEAVNDAIDSIKDGCVECEANELPDSLMLVFDDLTEALENVVESWDEYVNEHDLDDEFVDDIDCHLNEMLVNHVKLADKIGLELD